MAGDVWKFAVLAGKGFNDEKVAHPTQKPLTISTKIVEHFSNAEDLLVIPFGGSGTECLAAAMGHRRFIGYELNPEYIEIADKRISDWQNSLLGSG